MKQQPKQYDDDDGRVICNMDVDGMKGHVKHKLRDVRVVGLDTGSDQMTATQAYRFTWYSILAVMLIALVFSMTMVLFVLFCTKIWFR